MKMSHLSSFQVVHWLHIRPANPVLDVLITAAGGGGGHLGPGGLFILCSPLIERMTREERGGGDIWTKAALFRGRDGAPGDLNLATIALWRKRPRRGGGGRPPRRPTAGATSAHSYASSHVTNVFVIKTLLDVFFPFFFFFLPPTFKRSQMWERRRFRI